jgi:hypothetical protein
MDFVILDKGGRKCHIYGNSGRIKMDYLGQKLEFDIGMKYFIQGRGIPDSLRSCRMLLKYRNSGESTSIMRVPSNISTMQIVPMPVNIYIGDYINIVTFSTAYHYKIVGNQGILDSYQFYFGKYLIYIKYTSEILITIFNGDKQIKRRKLSRKSRKKLDVEIDFHRLRVERHTTIPAYDDNILDITFAFTP